MPNFMVHWPDGGDPRKVRIGRVDRVTGRIIGNRPDPDIDLYAHAEAGPRPNKYQRTGTPTWSNDGWTATETRTVVDQPLDQVKAQRKEEATAKFRRVRDGGTTLTTPAGAVLLSTLYDAYVELAGVEARTAAGGGTQKGVTRSGSPVMFDNALATAAAQAIATHYDAAYSREYDLYVAINAASTVAEVLAIDITTGWPANPEPSE